mgnify:CR=1 FL=1
MIEYENIKDTLITVVSDYFYPRQLQYDNSISTLEYNTITQSFYPFSTTISSVTVYVKDKVGSPGNVTVQILDRNYNVKSSLSTELNEGWNTISVTVNNLISKHIHYLRIIHSGDSSNYYVLGASTINKFEDTLYADSSTLNVKLSFSAGTGEKIRKVYSPKEFVLEDYPIVTCDITARPRVVQRYLDPKAIEQQIIVTFTIYSRYPDEIDIIARRIERGLFKERINISRSIISPAGIGPITRMRENIFSRAISFNLRMFTRIE